VSEDRLQKILARSGMGSRRAAEEIITEGRVTVNGRVATLGDKADPEHDAIKVDGKRLHPPREHHYLLLNKPRAVMSTASDPEGRPTVLELVPLGLRKAMVPVGRLDFLTEGLILLTDDGDFAQRVAHPRYGCTKTYEVKVRGTPDTKSLERLRRGIVLEGERTRPAAIDPRPVKSDTGNSWWTVELGQGRTRQIREMFKRIGHPVMKLRRVAIGPVRDPDLGLGQIRELSEKEVELLRRAGKHRAKAQAAKALAEREGTAAKRPAGKKTKTAKTAGMATGKKAKGAATARATGTVAGRKTKRAAAAKPVARRAGARDRSESEGRPERPFRATTGQARDRRPPDSERTAERGGKAAGGGRSGSGARAGKPSGGGRKPGGLFGAGRTSTGGTDRKAGPGGARAGGGAGQGAGGRKPGGGAGRKPGAGKAGGGAGRNHGPGGGKKGGGSGRKPGGGGRKPSGGSSGGAGRGDRRGSGGSGGSGRR
jgi:23S rRNA pseudouridine2605 synthase